MIMDTVKKELEKRNDFNELVRKAFHKNFTITFSKKDKLRKFVIQNAILRELGLDFAPRLITDINLVLKKEGLEVVNCQGYKSFRGVIVRTNETL